MVTAVAPLPRRRPLADPVVPFPRWRVVAIVALGLLLSAAGWWGYGKVDAAQDEAHRLAAVATAEARDADMAQLQGNEGRALASIVVYRCDTSQIRDVQLCDTARKIVR